MLRSEMILKSGPVFCPALASTRLYKNVGKPVKLTGMSVNSCGVARSKTSFPSCYCSLLAFPWNVCFSQLCKRWWEFVEISIEFFLGWKNTISLSGFFYDTWSPKVKQIQNIYIWFCGWNHPTIAPLGDNRGSWVRNENNHTSITQWQVLTDW